MIIDTLNNAAKYYGVHPLFEQAFAYLNGADLENTESGTYIIDGDKLKVIYSNKQGMTVDQSTAKFECHNKHIDIQLCINGLETFGWKPRGKCVLPKGEYNPEKDVLYFNDAPDMFFQLTNLQFVILFPEDVHAPMIADDLVKKLVIKVKI
jgi:biofilm protein TabA